MKHGFTLIELMVVVAIIAILAATAVPVYDKYVDEASRTEAHVNLADIASKENAFYMAWDTYQSTQASSGGADENHFNHTSDSAYSRTVQSMTANDEWVTLGYVFHDDENGGLFGGPVYFKYMVVTNADGDPAFVACAHRWLGSDDDAQEQIYLSSINSRSYISRTDGNCVIPVVHK